MKFAWPKIVTGRPATWVEGESWEVRFRVFELTVNIWEVFAVKSPKVVLAVIVYWPGDDGEVRVNR